MGETTNAFKILAETRFMKLPLLLPGRMTILIHTLRAIYMSLKTVIHVSR
jgi:hypothetical protein